MKKTKIILIVIMLAITILLTGYSNAEENEFINNILNNNNTITTTIDGIEQKGKATQAYFGTLDCNLWNLYVGKDNNGYYMDGNIDVFEWVNDKTKAMNITPKIELVSTDGKVVYQFNVNYRRNYNWGGTEYYIYLDIDGIDIWKEYNIRVTNLDKNNTNSTKTKYAIIPNWTIGSYWEFNVKIRNSKIYFKNTLEYYGILDCNLWEITIDENNNGYYIDGNIDVLNWVEDKTKIMSKIPKIQLISTDGKVEKDFYIEYRRNYDWGGTQYYIYLDIDGIDIWKEYYIKIIDTDSNNKNSNNYKVASIEDGKIGSYWEYIVGVSENAIYFGNTNYIGIIDCNLWNIKAGHNNSGYYIEGNIDICEWVGNQTIAPLGTPKIQLVSTDGKVVKDFYVEYRGNYDWGGTQYYIYLDIDGIDVWKEYNIRLTDTSHKNNSSIKTKNANLKTTTIGNYWEYNINTEEEALYFIITLPKVKYQSYINQSGWSEYSRNEVVSGNPGSGKDITSFKISLYGAVNSDQHIAYKVYQQGIGWLDTVRDGKEAGQDLNKRIEAMNIELENMPDYSVVYNVYIEGIGWQGWAYDNEMVGIIGKRIEGIQIGIVPKITEKKALMELDKPYPYNNTITVNKGKNEISGWMISNQKYANIKILIDEKEISSEIERFERWDIHDKNKGFGGAVTTPYPGFRLYADFGKYTSGTTHKVQIQAVDSNGKVMTSKSFNVYISNISYGIDVSEYNGVINWNQVAKTQDFAIIRVGIRGYGYSSDGTWGKIKADTRFATNMMQAQAAGLKLGAYFITQAINEQEAIQEANWVADMLSGYNITYPVFVDTEWSTSPEKKGRADGLSVEQRTKNIKAFVDTIQSRGYKGAIYANKWWFKDQLDESQLENYEKWVAHYTGDINTSTDYDKPYTIWQYTESGTIDGINGKVDQNICYKEY